MKLNNSQCDSIMRMYDARQSRTRNKRAKRLEDICQKIPEYDELCRRMVEISAAAARSAIEGDRTGQAEWSDRLSDINRRKKTLLADAGYPENYLEPEYECPRCKDTGFVDGQKCSCFIQAAIDLLYNQSNIKKILQVENFSFFNYDWYSKEYIDRTMEISALDNIKNVVAGARSFIDNFPSGQNMLLYGDTGVGKTFLTHCIAKELLDNGRSVLYLSAIDLFDLFSRYTFDNDSSPDSREVCSQILDCELLIIDDLGTELSNSFTNSKLFFCVNERISHGLSTIISTNLNLEELMTTYSERIFSRLIQSYDIFKIFGYDIRLRKRG